MTVGRLFLRLLKFPASALGRIFYGLSNWSARRFRIRPLSARASSAIRRSTVWCSQVALRAPCCIRTCCWSSRAVPQYGCELLRGFNGREPFLYALDGQPTVACTEAGLSDNGHDVVHLAADLVSNLFDVLCRVRFGNLVIVDPLCGFLRQA
jgi:hypothetical protein